MDEYAEVLSRISEIYDELLEVESDDFAKRHRLLTERDGLRSRVHEFQGDAVLTDDRPTPQIERELAALRANAEALYDQQIDLVTQAGGGSQTNEMGNLGGIGLNHRMAEATGLNSIRQRIGQLEAILDNRQKDSEA